MRDNEWSLIYPGTEITFGPVDLPIANLAAPDFGTSDVQTDDAPRPRGDGVAFGTDFRGGRTVTFDLGIACASEEDARDTLAALQKAWRGDAVRQTPGAVAELHVQYVDRERVMYGRPRRFAATEDLAYQGWIEVVCDFSTADDVFYGAADFAVTLGIVPPVGGGLIAPLASPLTSTSSSDRSEVVTVGGDLPAWPVVTFYGPITSPSLALTGLWTLALDTSIAAGDAVTIDTRPWARTVLRSSGGSLAGLLTRTSARLSAASIPPGTHEVVLTGVDGTGTASVTVSGRETYSTI